ncbi:MAG: HK97 family phage prohead protease [Akkermansiaceae bacterium]|nr:HK97 family phage prohead protease [Akkermansiaceae bacterium]
MKPQENTTERRFVCSGVELRAQDGEGEKRTIRGYAAKFGKRSENLGNSEYQFFETLESGCFDDVLNDDVRALFNHDPSQILARSKGGEGTLRIGTDETGLWYEFDAPQTRAGNDLLESIRRGDIDQSSFGFCVERDGQKWEEKRDGEGPTVINRIISKVTRLLDVSPVTYPAYPDATVALRSLEQFQKENRDEPEPEEKPECHWERRLDLISKTPAVN